MDHTKLDIKDLFIDYNATTNFGDYTITIQQDDEPENPREWENLGTMICFHNNYKLGDDHNYDSPDHFFHCESGLYEHEDTCYLTEKQLDRCRKVVHQKNIMLPLYLYDHGGITMSTSGFSCPWDSGQVGYIMVSREAVRKEYSWKLVTQKRREQIAKYLTNEVKIYDHFITGSVYGFTITNGEKDIDSSWGFFGYHTDDDNYMVNTIKDAITFDIKHTPQQSEMVL